MPQYPGGLKALLSYLKKNLHVPDEVEEGKQISVKVKFVVNFNGKLESFQVIESGGEVFDNEVYGCYKRCRFEFLERVMEKMYRFIILYR